MSKNETLPHPEFGTQNPDLKWGTTPWDEMSQPELLNVVKSLYSALNSAYSVLYTVRHNAIHNGIPGSNLLFWNDSPDEVSGRMGRGGEAFYKSEKALEQARGPYTEEDISRAYFRYADDFLFPASGIRWNICPECGRLLKPGAVGQVCDTLTRTGCQGILRWMTIHDLVPCDEDGRPQHTPLGVKPRNCGDDDDEGCG